MSDELEDFKDDLDEDFDPKKGKGLLDDDTEEDEVDSTDDGDDDDEDDADEVSGFSEEM